jgi:hypothetical protein
LNIKSHINTSKQQTTIKTMWFFTLKIKNTYNFHHLLKIFKTKSQLYQKNTK